MDFKTSRILAMSALLLLGLASIVLGQDMTETKPRAMFLAMPPHSYYPVTPASSQLTQWSYTFTYQGQKFNPVIVGTDPRKTNVTTTIPVFIVPIKMVFPKSIRLGPKTYDPNKQKFKGSTMTVTQNLATSPLFTAGLNFRAGTVDLGKTQYEDAYERGSFWRYVKTNNKYHVVFGSPTILPEQTVNVTSGDGRLTQNPYGNTLVGYFNLYTMDALIQGWIHKFKIQPNALPLFLTYDVYLDCGDRCTLGGYHSANAGPPSGQTYAFATEIDPDSMGVSFSSDTGAFSHELGEWLVDPFVANPACGGLMEVGDPLETEPHFGLYTYKLNNFEYHLQDLVFINYFGAPRNSSALSWYTLRNESISSPCSRGQS